MKKDELALIEYYSSEKEAVADEKEQFDLQELNMSDEELFAHQDHSDLESEKITAPRYSYWKSVFRVFFKRKINAGSAVAHAEKVVGCYAVILAAADYKIKSAFTNSLFIVA